MTAPAAPAPWSGSESAAWQAGYEAAAATATEQQQLRVWWIPQVPMTAFYVRVKSVAEAKLLLKTLADYDAFQFEHDVKPDYSNTCGLEAFDGTEWLEWEDADGASIDDVMDGEAA